MTEREFADFVTWAMCEMAAGGGPGKCDPEHCVCGAEGKYVARSLYGKGWNVVVLRHPDHVSSGLSNACEQDEGA